ncbi:DUF4230 domain-containing protein [Streptococcus himalayensis]|uniref:DUF4230 domain-containing protein n=1 Tax=Streptococcus himalayensis TaxID=1888195 RepID=A0A917A582_9STRE|nr:DUF4230 domain-containing protein [Streptococcus himalayensis]GGE27651.1 hypothetical protein GCM10011510_06040 [Streptococcus himalayensis]
MKKIKRTIYLALAFLAVFAIGGFAASHFSGGQTQITSSLIKNRLEAAKELVTTKYYYTNVGSFENHQDFYGWKVPFTTKKFILSYDGVIHAGMDLEQMTVQVKGKTIQLTLPEAKILSHEIDDNSLKVFDEKNSIFNSIQIEDYTSFAKGQKEKLEKEAIDKGLYKKTVADAKVALKDLLLASPDINQGYQIEFVTK